MEDKEDKWFDRAAFSVALLIVLGLFVVFGVFCWAVIEIVQWLTSK